MRRSDKSSLWLFCFLLLCSSQLLASEEQTQSQSVPVLRNPRIVPLVKHDISPPLREIPPAQQLSGIRRVRPNRMLARPPIPGPPAPDPVLQSFIGAPNTPTVSSTFEGVGEGLAGYSVNVAPPDPVIDVGPNHIVEAVNSSLAVFSKAGTIAAGFPKSINTLWSGFGGLCETHNDGDPTINYDQAADRWIIAQFAIVQNVNDFECIAVSTSSDPTGSYYRYAYDFGTDFDDYPKMGIWPDAYYVTFNIFPSAGGGLGRVCAFDRSKLLSDQANTMQCFDTGSQGLLPSDMDGTSPPSAGSPNYVVRFGTNQLQLYKFHVDWNNPANSTFTGPVAISVAAFTQSCISFSRGACIPQPVVTGQTTPDLESLADRLMNRFAYRNYGTNESLVVTHTIGGDSAAQVRWYEIRDPNGTPSVFQSGTFAPDTDWRWMASIAMDSVGNMGLGYSISSSTLKPGIRYTGRLVADAPGTMGAEQNLFSGSGSQAGEFGNPLRPLKRWGDYTAMVVDPADDCTFWYVNQYLVTDDIFNWHTRIGSFKFPNCSCLPAPTGVNATPNGNNRIDVSWNSVVGATEYRVFRSTISGGPYTQIGTAVTNGYSDTTVSGGTTYFYVVRAFNGCESANSSQVSATATGPCTLSPSFAGLVSVTNPANSNCRLDLSWNAGASNCSSPLYYNVYRSTTPSFTPSSANRIAGGVTATSFSDTNSLTNGTTYYYIVRAVDSSNSIEETNTVTRSGVPLGPIVTNTLFSDTFESGSGLNGWQAGLFAAGSAADWRGIQTCVNHTSGGSKIFRFGGSADCTADYGNSVFAFVKPGGSAGISVPAGSTNTTLDFWHKWDFENGFDGATLLLRLNSGSYFFVPASVITTGAYNGTTSTSCPPTNGGGRSVWTGTSAGYPNSFVNTIVDLDAMCNAILGTSTGCAGNILHIAFAAITDCANTADGWFLDDVLVTVSNQTSCSATNTVKPVGTLQANKITSDGSQINVTWTTTCSDANYNIYYGNGSQISSSTPAGSQCSVSPSSGYTWLAPAVPGGESFIWWIITGEDGVSTESSWGTNSAGNERHPAASGVCGNTAKSSATCP